MKLCQITVNDPIIIVLYRNEFCETYILSNGHETCQSCNLELVRLNIYLHVISTNFETGLPRYNLCIFRRGWNLSCYRSDPIIMKILSEQFVLKLCQIDNLCQSWGKLKLLLMKINLTFSGGQKLRIFGRSWNFLRSQFWNLEQFFWNYPE